MLDDIESDLFADLGNLSNYHSIKKPQKDKQEHTKYLLHPSKGDFYKKTTKELVSVISDE
jgi:hypothetical protein